MFLKERFINQAKLLPDNMLEEELKILNHSDEALKARVEELKAEGNTHRALVAEYWYWIDQLKRSIFIQEMSRRSMQNNWNNIDLIGKSIERAIKFIEEAEIRLGFPIV